MKRFAASLSLAVLLLAAGSGWAWAREVSLVVLPIHAEAQYAHDAEVMTRLLRNELEGIKDTTIIDAPGKVCHQIKCAKSVRKNYDADAAVIGELTTFGGKLTLLIDAVWEDEVLSYNPALEEIAEYTKIVGRLADSIRNRKPWEAARGVDSVSVEEMYPYKNKVHGMWKVGGSLGMFAPMGDTLLGADYLVGLLPRFRYEIAQIAIEGESGVLYTDSMASGDSLTAIPIELSTHYYLMNSDFSPYFGATFGAHLLFTGLRQVRQESQVMGQEDTYTWDYDDNYWMFVVGGYAGLELLRTHTLNVNFRLGYKYGFVDFDEATLPEGVDNGAHGVYFQVGITFDLPTVSYKTNHSDRYRYNKSRHFRYRRHY